MKMDIEGAEYAIFNSTPGSVFNKIDTISLEFHDLKDRNNTAEQLISRLLDNNFKIVKFQYDRTFRNLNYGKIIATKNY